MIPLRIYAEGFMCFREPAEMTFDGGSLWMLTGANGAGKSAVFDAILYALFGTHRKGTENAHFVLNQGSQCNLVVEFDFAVGDCYYRVRRTLSRKCRPAFQAFEGGVAQWRSGKLRAVDETDSKAGLDKWVARITGLNEKAFTTSVFLRQGKSDALLSADKKERHAILGQIVDLSKYQSLEKRADELRKTNKDKADVYGSQLQTIEPVEDAAVAALTARIEEAAATVAATRAQLDNLIELKVESRRWSELTAERTRLESEMRAAESLLGAGEGIERDASESADLERALPPLRKLSKDEERLKEAAADETRLRDEAARHADAHSLAQVALNDAQTTYDGLDEEQANARRALSTKQETLSQLAPQVARVERLRELRRDLARLDEQLSEFPSDLDERVSEGERSLKTLNELRAALPSLTHYAGARTNWTSAQAQAEAIVSGIERLDGELSRASATLEAIESEVSESQTTLTEAERRSTEAELFYAQVHDRLFSFARLDGHAECDLCGQVLTPEHMDAERMRLDSELLKRDADRRAADEQRQTAVARLREKRGATRKAGDAVTEIERRGERARVSLAAAREVQKQAEQQARTALDALPVEYARRSGWTNAADVTRSFAVEFPTAADLAELQARVAQYGSVEQQVQSLRLRHTERRSLVDRRASLHVNLEPLESEYPAHRERQVTAAHDSARQEVEAHKQDLKRVEVLLDSARHALTHEREAAEAVAACQREAANGANIAAMRKQELEQSINRTEAELGDSWREVARSLTADELSEMENRAKELAGAAGRLRELHQARDQQAVRRTRYERIEGEIAGIDVRARRPFAEVEAEERQVRRQHDDVDAGRRRAEDAKRDMEERRERRRTLEARRLEHASKAELYKELAMWLGKEKLQHYLLGQAETSIVHNANGVLDRVSGGTLRLDLSKEDDPVDGEGKSKGRGGVKTLDLVAFHSATGADAIPVEFLSGSQRFRVAVSLALGIGQYASHGARRIESVIIDEGFGSLDKQGCRDMIVELQRLKDVLRRIILVSHQEEVADAFPNNKYLVELVDGASRVKLVESC